MRSAVAKIVFPGRWPLAAKVPLLVTLLMFVVSAVITNRVLSRLQETQARQMQELAATYLDGLSAALMPAVERNDVWEVFDTLDRSRERYRGLNIRWTAVTDADGRVIAASDPLRFPSQSTPSLSAKNEGQEVKLNEAEATAFLDRVLRYQDRPIGRVFAEADISKLLAERDDVFATLLLTNVVLTVILAGLGFIAVRRMLEPVRILSNHLDAASQGHIAAIPAATTTRQTREFRRLFGRYNALAQAVNERETLAMRLAEEEKLASLGRLASGMAHEINNPLGGLFNALDALRRHGERGDVRSRSIRLIETGLAGIRDLVKSTLATYRTEKTTRPLSETDLADLLLLLEPEAKQKNLHLAWHVTLPAPVSVPAVAIRDALLNLLINACRASPAGEQVTFSAYVDKDVFIAEVTDRGTGLPPAVRAYIEEAETGTMPPEQGRGLGLWIVKRRCDEIGAALTVIQSGVEGTTLRFTAPIKTQELLDAA